MGLGSSAAFDSRSSGPLQRRADPSRSDDGRAPGRLHGATFGDDQSLWRVSKDVFPFGRPYYSGADGDAMKGDLTLAAEMLKEARSANRAMI